MKRTPKNKEATHLRRKMALYESFLYSYLPQIASLSLITRLNIFDVFGSYGLDKLGTQGTPFTLYHALRKQRQHQLKKKSPLKPFSLNLVNLLPQPSFHRAMEQLQQENMNSNTCKLEGWSGSWEDGFRKISRQLPQQGNNEKNLLFLDILGLPGFSPAELKAIVAKKVDVLLYLPLKALWRLHSSPEKANASEDLSLLKESLDKLFPEEHPYWSEEITPPLFIGYLKEAFRLNGTFYSVLEPSDADIPEGALLAISKDVYILEKMLHGLQALRTDTTPPPGEQLLLFGSEIFPKAVPEASSVIIDLLQNEMDNQQLYETALGAGILPSQVMESLIHHVETNKLEVLDEKGKRLKGVPAQCIGYSAFKAAKPVCYFRKAR